MSRGFREAPRGLAPGAAADLVSLWLTMGIAAVAVWPIYRSQEFVVLALVAILLGTAIAVLGAIFRWAGWVVLLVTVAVFALVGVPLAVPGQAVAGVLPSVDGLLELFAAVALGWKQLLTITLPVGSYQALLVPALVLMLGATVVAGSIAFRARYGELAAIAPATVLLVAIVFGPADAEAPILLGLAMLVACVVWASWRKWRRRRALTRESARDAASSGLRFGVEARALAGGVAILAVASLGSVVVATVIPPAGEREVLRNAVAQPFDPREHTSPLASYRRSLLEDRSTNVMLEVTGLAAGSRIRIATLDSYDGVVYAVGSPGVDTASGVFVRLPSAIARDPRAGDPVRLDVIVHEYTGVWVPTVGMLADIEFRGTRASALEDGFAFNETTGTAADLRGLREGDSYRLDAIDPWQPTIAELASAVPGSADVPPLTQAPDELVAALDGYVDGVDGAGARLVAAIDGLRAEGYVSHGVADDEPASRSGHSLDRIGELFSAPLMIGDAEQYAVAAALMADRLGFPARVVVGFAPDVEGDGPVLVRGMDLTAWIEVDTAQYGWVAIEPVPVERPIPEEEPEEPVPVARPESIVPPPADRPDPREEQSDPDTVAQEPEAPDTTLDAVLRVLAITGLVLLVIAVLLSPFLVVLAAKARRRHLRRTASGTLARIRGGWDEFADLVVDHGLVIPSAATRSEFAAQVGTLPSRVLAAVVDRAVFAPDEPSEADADRVWVAVAELRRALDAGKRRRDRLRARLSVRSLGGGAVRRLLSRPGGRP